MKVTAAVRELEVEYADRVDFVIVSPEDTAAATEDIEAFGFQDDGHGLVVFDDEGKVAGKLPGHTYGRAEIEAQLKTVL